MKEIESIDEPAILNYLKERQQNRQTLAHYTRQQLVEICLDLLENEREMRKELDKLQGIIR